jgi:hypothetical protein
MQTEILSSMPGTKYEFASRSRDVRFYATMIFLSAVVVFAGFSPTFYFARQFGSPRASVVPAIHGVVMTLWLIYLIIQTTLAASNRIALHRRLGWTGAVLGSAALLSQVFTTFWMVTSGDFHSLPPFVKDAETATAWTLGDAFQFALFFAIGFCFRRRREIHQRSMLLLTVCTLAPQGLGRLSGILHSPVPILFIYVFVFVGPIYDLVTRRRIHGIYLLGVPLFMALSPGIKVAIGSTAAWHNFVHWVVRVA